MMQLAVINADKQMMDHLLNQGGSLGDTRAGEIALQFASAALSDNDIAMDARGFGLGLREIALAFCAGHQVCLDNGRYICQYNQPVSPMCALVADKNAFSSRVAMLAHNQYSIDVQAQQRVVFDRALWLSNRLLEDATKSCNADYAAKKVRNRSQRYSAGCASLILIVLVLSAAVTAAAVAFS